MWKRERRVANFTLTKMSIAIPTKCRRKSITIVHGGERSVRMESPHVPITRTKISNIVRYRNLEPIEIY
jgi:hypothetical protein